MRGISNAASILLFNLCAIAVIKLTRGVPYQPSFGVDRDGISHQLGSMNFSYKLRPGKRLQIRSKLLVLEIGTEDGFVFS
jgi:hypothetical protein